MISPDIEPNAAEPGAYGIACDLISSLPAQIDIAFTSQEGVPFNLTIPSSELNVGPFTNDPKTCQTLINAFDGLSLVGGSLLKHYYSIWDVGGQRLGFATPADSSVSNWLTLAGFNKYFKVHVRLLIYIFFFMWIWSIRLRMFTSSKIQVWESASKFCKSWFQVREPQSRGPRKIQLLRALTNILLTYHGS